MKPDGERRGWAEWRRVVRGRAKKGGWGFGAMGWHWLAAAVRGQGGDAVRRAGGGLGLGRRGTRRLAGRHSVRCGAK